MPYIRPKCRPFRLAPYASYGTCPALYDDALLRPTCHSIRTARRLYRLASCSARYMSESVKFTRSLFIRRIRTSAKFNRELRRKNQEPSKKAPDKILRRKIKIGSHKLAQKSDFKAKFSAKIFKKSRYLAISL